MALKFKTVLAHKSNYGSKRSISDIKYIVIHYTGNNNDTALNNCKYFQGSNRHASAHYFVDGGTYIYKSVPVDTVAWSVGGLYSRSNGAGSYYGQCTNANSLSIEMCDSVSSVPSKVYNQAVELTKYLMKEYGVPASHVIRHYDVNGKTCPAPWVGKNNSGWNKFKKDIVAAESKSPKPIKAGKYDAYVKVINKDIAVRNGKGIAHKKLGVLKKGTKVKVINITKNKVGNLWGSIKYNSKTGYIKMKNCKAVKG